MKTELGIEFETTAKTLEDSLTECVKATRKKPSASNEMQINISKLFAQLDVFRLAIKQFYGIEYFFRRTDEYYGMTTEDETDWLFKHVREER
ncbi:hypothetical protein [Anaerosporobacter sp.]|uniref:hypothetical protein n=1 Tax=Anaerosporobacter sp. TaxID=1872529 RepID=UPI00286EC3A9|nr:hypothetical protein [Anaerosporobacter sp.]